MVMLEVEWAAFYIPGLGGGDGLAGRQSSNGEGGTWTDRSLTVPFPATLTVGKGWAVPTGMSMMLCCPA